MILIFLHLGPLLRAIYLSKSYDILWVVYFDGFLPCDATSDRNQPEAFSRIVLACHKISLCCRTVVILVVQRSGSEIISVSLAHRGGIVDFSNTDYFFCLSLLWAFFRHLQVFHHRIQVLLFRFCRRRALTKRMSDTKDETR